VTLVRDSLRVRIRRFLAAVPDDFIITAHRIALTFGVPLHTASITLHALIGTGDVQRTHRGVYRIVRKGKL
jgi:predicted transcriptional regulator of viral defense system